MGVIRFTKSGRRWFGALSLAGAVIMLLAGQTILASRLSGGMFVAYWCVCLLLTCFALLAAIVDAARVRAESREHQRELIESTLREIEAKKETRARNSSGASPKF